MAFPTVTRAATGSTNLAGSTSETIPRPASVPDEALVVVVLGFKSPGMASTGTSGWTVLGGTSGGVDANTEANLTTFWGIAGHATWPLVATHGAGRASWQVFSLTGHNGQIFQAEERFSGSSPTAPTLAPGIGEREFVWIFGAAWPGNRTIGVPSGYTSAQELRTGPTSSHIGTTTAWKTSVAESETPGTAPGGVAQTGGGLAIIGVPAPPAFSSPLEVLTSSGWQPLDIGAQVLTPDGWA